MRRTVAATLVAGLLLTAPATADAITLGKREARAVALDILEERFNERRFNWVTWWDVEPARKCSRRGPRTMLCDFQYIDENDVDEEGYMYGCEDTIRVRESSESYWYSFPQRPDCGYWWTE